MENTLSRLNYLALIGITLFIYAGISHEIRANSRAETILPSLQQQVTGVVTDENGLPIPGVAISIKDSSTGTTSDLEGRYSISVGSQDVLVITYLGMVTKEEPVNGRSEINIMLEEDVTALGEVEINAGYYYTTRRESTGNISRVTAEEIELQPVVSPIEALQGRMAGVEIIPGGSHPGMASTIRIRGTNSLRTEGNFPLYIIDGVPINSTPVETNSLSAYTGFDPLNNINLSTIESIEVLKDADATSIYGSRGANGVVLITTKKGTPGKTGIEAQVYTGAATFPTRLKLLNTDQYLQIRRKAFENDGVEPTPSNAYDLTVYDQERYTDWQDFFFGGTSTINDVNLSTTGGVGNTTFRLGGSFQEQGSVYFGDYNYKKVTGSLNVNHTSEDKKLSVNLSVNYGTDHNNSIGLISITQRAFGLPPNAPAVLDDNGELNWKDWNDAGQDNPMEGAHNESSTRSVNFLTNLNLSYELTPGLTLISSLGYTEFNSNELVKRPKRSYNPADWETTKNRSSSLQGRRGSWIIEPQLNYAKTIGKSNINAIVGTTFQESEYYTSTFQAEGYVTEALIGNLNAAENIYNAQSSNTDYRYNALFGRLGYNWDRKYFLNLTGRRDGSSRFGPDKKIANFWAIGAAWIFVEDYSNSFLSFGKLRGSYGTTGSDNIEDYGYLDAYEATRGPGGLYPTQLTNPNYSWEVNKKLEAAIDLGFLEDRVTLGVSWFRNRSSNQLVGYSLPGITGFRSVQANLPATVENTGLEIVASSLNITSKDFEWRTFFNISFPKNKLVSYPDIENSSYANQYKVGHPLNISLLYEYDGLDPETGFYNAKDVNENGYLDYEDRTQIWFRGKEFFGGISNDLSYKNFSLQFLFEFTKQEGSLDLFDAGSIGQLRTEVMEALEEGTRFQNVSASVAARRAYSNVQNTLFPIVDASYIRLKTASFSYHFPAPFLKATGLSSGRVFINAQNLFTFTSYKGLDPAMPHMGTQFANLRTITGGLTLTL